MILLLLFAELDLQLLNFLLELLRKLHVHLLWFQILQFLLDILEELAVSEQDIVQAIVVSVFLEDFRCLEKLLDILGLVVACF